MIALGCLLATLVIYWGAKRVYRAFPRVYLTPLLVAPVIIIGILTLAHLPYPSYEAGTHWLTRMIGPATVAMAIPLYQNFGMLKKHAAEITLSVLFGSAAALISSAWMARELHLDNRLVESLAPRSATTPIAMAVSERIGGIPTMTAVFVILTGLSGMILGPYMVRLLRIRSEVSRGVLFGTSSHNAGTSKAFESGSAAGSIASISMILTAFFTLLLAPWLMP
ncbi:LrgB family protein [Paenibacillus aurantius]|uniref:LrgB family protein n=1 Tax=Paenibacillus aurantius TaxID=2918900 RepID=A0AA96L9B5_9BACL|nr:LrgB family protein [Paenibacillus aurantius]WNQ08869.1 LrgB family protein [Paenibacillus aurantius]